MEELKKMAKSKLSYKRNVTDQLSVKGVLSEDATEITYVDENDDEQSVKISDLLSVFADKDIDFTVSLKKNEDLELPVDTNEE